MKRALLILASLVLIGAGAYSLYRYYQHYVLPESQLDAAYEAQLQLFASAKPAPSLPPEDAPAQMQEDPLASLRQVNPAAVAWLTIPDTHLDYPIVQGEDNDYYLHHGFDGAYN